jgi:hypothetical protein
MLTHGIESRRVSTLERLLQAVPVWASFTRMGNGSAAITAAVPRAGGTLSRRYSLVLTAHGTYVSVKETDYVRLIPASCPDRHINPNGTFCLGLRAGHLVEDAKVAGEWWDKLLVFLTCQETAHETRTWPDYAQLSHGNEAAEIQLDAEDVARELGLHEEYKDTLRGNEGAITVMARRVDLKTMHLRNGRAACVCGRSDKRRGPLLRRQCWKADLKCLPVLERQRQEAVKRFWATFDDTPCCGTMDGCPLHRIA